MAVRKRWIVVAIATIVMLVFLDVAGAFQEPVQASGRQVGLAEAPPAADLPLSAGVYRIPYANGTLVMVSADHSNHALQRNKLDLQGVPSPGGYQIVAADDGWIDRIIDWHDTFCPLPPEPEAPDPCLNYGGPSASCCVRSDSTCQASCANNTVWIRHTNGEVSRYAHLQTNSATDLGWQEGDLIRAGEALGREGDVGFTTGPHLHFEIAAPYDPANYLTSSGVLVDDGDAASLDFNRQNRIPYFCGYGVVARYDFVLAADCGR